MRKKYFYILSICFILVCVGVAIFRKPKNIKVSCIEEPLSVVSNVKEKDYLKIKLFVSEKKSYYTDINKMTSSELTDGNNTFKLKIESINRDNDTKYNINNNTMYLFDYEFLINFSTYDDYEVFLNDATLRLCFANGIDSNVKVGSFSYYKYNKEDTNINLISLSPITKVNDVTIGFLGFNIGLRNSSSDNINIQSIELLDGNIKKLEVIKLDEKCNEKELTKIFNEYTMPIDNYSLNYSIDSKEEIYLSCKLNDIDSNVSNVGIKITYKIGDNIYSHYIEKFLFYQENTINMSKVNFVVYEYKNS